MPIPSISIGLIGLGTVGSGVAEILTRHARRISQKVGAEIHLKRIAVRDPKKLSKLGLDKTLYAKSWEEIVADPSISVIVELIGGVTDAKKIVLAALKNGKHVVTANKALLAIHGKEILDLAHQKQLDVCFEAAVGGGIPILRALREGFAANEIYSISAIINGTCNYILSEMSEKGEDFEPTLKKAQELGYAERDPSFDIDGIDAAHKLVILLSIAYGVYAHPDQIYVEGIRRITAFDIACARQFGYVIKLLAIAKKTARGIEARVHPCMVAASSPLASVRDAFNAILIEGDYVGPSLLYGRGAGKNPTASAVVGDIVEVARNLIGGTSHTVPPLGHLTPSLKEAKFIPIQKLESAYYLRFRVNDRPGVLAQITGILGKNRISISSVYQQGEGGGQEVPIVILTHKTLEANVRKALAAINRLKAVKEETLFVRIEG